MLAPIFACRVAFNENERVKSVIILPLIHQHQANELETVFDGCKHAILHFEMKFPKEKFVLIGVYSWFKSLFGSGYAGLGVRKQIRLCLTKIDAYYSSGARVRMDALK